MTAETLNIWITGAGSGIGEQLARRYAALGHRVVISGRTREKLEALCSEYAGNLHALPFDVSDADAVPAVAAQLAALLPHLDLVILNAGTCEYVDSLPLDPALFQRVMATNFHGLVHSFNAASALLLKSPRPAHLVGICSMAAFVGFPRAEAYGASKAAAAYFLHSLRARLAGKVDVTVVNPGFVATPMTASNDFPMPFLTDSERAAEIMIRRLRKRPLSLDFPARLALLLRLAQCLPGLWYRRIVPGLLRKQRQNSEAGA